VSGLRERKKLATRLAIHEAGMRLFAERGFAATTIDQIAEAADVSRATVFGYFPTKEEIVFGDASVAIGALAEGLAARPAGLSTVEAVRGWLGDLSGWIDPDLPLQLRLSREVPSVGARRLQLRHEIQDVLAGALLDELGPGRELTAQLAAAVLVTALNTVEELAAARMEEDGRELSGEEIDRLLDDAMAFIEAGVQRS
jgi:AcrR family transcriptional regulator